MAWQIGDDLWAENPAHLLPDSYRALVRLWAACRGSMGGFAHWPDPGGVNDQAAWLMDAFALLSNQDAEWNAERRGGR